jgi:hypothetical protein
VRNAQSSASQAVRNMSWVRKKSERFGRNMTYSRGFYSTACAKKLKKAAQTMQRNIAQHTHQSRQNAPFFCRRGACSAVRKQFSSKTMI